MDRPAIVAEGLRKRFDQVEALRGLDLKVPTGAVLGLLGPRGAGKTTTVRILATLLKPDGGRAEVGGHDVVGNPEKVRVQVGLMAHDAAMDETLTGRENLQRAGSVHHLGEDEARRRADELLQRVGLSHAGDRPVETYSVGMRRRLDLGAILVGGPSILFLDEPTSGLDPRSRLDMWDAIGELAGEGRTLLLTTEHLDEADRLSNRVAVIDRGRVIAEGTADELKARAGGDVVDLRIADPGQLRIAADEVSGLGRGVRTDGRESRVSISVDRDGPAVMAEAIRRLEAAGVALADLVLRRPTLDDLLLALTGHGVEEDRSQGEEQADAGTA